MAFLSFRFIRALLIALAVVAGCGSCSRDAKKSGLLQKADRYFASGDYDKAEIEYKNVLQLGGIDPEAVGRLGIIYYDQGRLGKAYPFLLRASELKPDNLPVRLKLGYLQFASGKIKEARENAVFILDRKPQDPEAAILLAEAITAPQEAAEARARLQKASPPGAESAPIISALALINMRERKYREAEADLLRAQKLDPRLPTINSSLARLYWARNDLAEAGRAFQAAAEAAPPRSPIRLQQVQFQLQTGHPDIAKKLLEDSIQKTPDFLPAYLLLANIAMAEKRYDDSIGLLNKVLAREPDHPEAMLLSAQALTASGKKERALAILQKAASMFGSAPQVQQELGTAYLANGDLSNAAACFAQAIKLAPGYPPATLALARINIRQAEYGTAIASLKAFVQKNPTMAEARFLLADAQRGQGNLDEALTLYRQLADASPRNPQASLMAGMVLMQQNKGAEARQAFTKTLEIAPDSLLALEQLVILDMGDKQPAAALARLNARLAKEPKNAGLYILLAKVHLAQGNNTDAENALLKTLELQPDAQVAHQLLSQLYLKTNELPKAMKNLQAAAAKNPKDYGSLMLMGVLQEQQKDFTAARESYEKVLAINPKAGGALNNLAYLYAERFGELEKATDLAQRAREVLPNQGETADTLGWILFKRGQYPRAVTLLTDSAEKLPNNAEVQYHRGMAHYMMGEEESAREAFERALKLGNASAGMDEAKLCLAVLTLDVGKDLKGARALVEQAIARRKDDPVALTRLAEIHRREGNVEKAINTYETALQAHPSNATAAVGLIRLYRSRNETAKAFELAKATRKLAPSDARLAHALGRLAYETGDFTWSVSLLQEAARKLAEDPEVLYDLGEASYSVGQISAAKTAMRDALQAGPTFAHATEARQFLSLVAAAEDPSKASESAATIEAALKLDGSNIAALMAKAALAEQTSNVATAEQAYEKALTRFPDFTPAKRRLAILYAAAPHQGKRALELATKAREAFPTDPEVAKALGIILSREGNHTRAVVLLQESARSLTTDAEVMYYLGMSQRQLKDQPGSTRSLNRALELGLPEKLAGEARQALAAKK